MSILFHRHFNKVTCVFICGLSFSSIQAADGLRIGLSGTVIAGGSTEGDAHLGDIQSGGHDPSRNGFSIPNIELSLSGAVDAYFDAQANVVLQINADGETVLELEEAFMVSRALPAGLQLKAGQYYTEFGRQNAMHPHTWAFVDQPVIASRLLGADGLRSQGARLSWLAPTPWYSEVYGGIQNASGETTASFIGVGSGHAHGSDESEGEAAFAEYPLVDRSINGAEDFLYSARWLNGFDHSDTISSNIGISALFGPNNTGQESATQIYGLDLYLKWQPENSQKGFPFVAWHTEVMRRSYEAGDDSNEEHQTLTDSGFFSYVQWGFKPNWILGVRYELASGSEVRHDEHAGEHEDEEPDPLRDSRQRISTNLTYLPTEFSKIRLQYNNDTADHLDGAAHSIWLQFEYSIGAHKAHSF